MLERTTRCFGGLGREASFGSGPPASEPVWDSSATDASSETSKSLPSWLAGAWTSLMPSSRRNNPRPVRRLRSSSPTSCDLRHCRRRLPSVVDAFRRWTIRFARPLPATFRRRSNPGLPGNGSNTTSDSLRDFLESLVNAPQSADVLGRDSVDVPAPGLVRILLNGVRRADQGLAPLANDVTFFPIGRTYQYLPLAEKARMFRPRHLLQRPNSVPMRTHPPMTECSASSARPGAHLPSHAQLAAKRFSDDAQIHRQ